MNLCKILRVVDGDTLDVEIDLGYHLKTVQRVRLLGLNCAEMKSGGQPAKDQVAKWVQECGGEAAIMSNKQDSFGRWLAEIVLLFDRPASLNQMLLHTGLALPYRETR